MTISPKFYSFAFSAMGSPCMLQLYSRDATHAKQMLSVAVTEVQRLEKKYSRYLMDNPMAAINDAAARGVKISIDRETWLLMNFADQCFQQSNGLFDISSGVLRTLWDFSEPQNIIQPDSAALRKALETVGWEYIDYNENQISFNRAGMQLDFGGIVKEYAADRVVSLLLEHNIQSALIDLGGDIAVTGARADRQPWRIFIRHPRKKGKHFACFELYAGGLASSGDYERFVEIDGVRYSHLLSPKTALPVRGLAAVSVHMPRCVLAGSLATIAMLKEHQGSKWLRQLNVSHVWMNDAMQFGGDKAVLDRCLR